MVLIGRVHREARDAGQILQILTLVGHFGVQDVMSSIAVYPNGDVVATLRAFHQLLQQPTGRQWLQQINRYRPTALFLQLDKDRSVQV